MEQNQKIVSINGFSNSPWGRAFSIGVIVMEDGEVTNKFMGRCPITEPVDSFVAENVLPQMEGIEINYPNYESLLQSFIEFYLDNNEEADVIVHLGLPVEARLFLDAHDFGYLWHWDAPYPLIDISAFPKVGDSVAKYNKTHNIIVSPVYGGTHNPLYGSMAIALCYQNICCNK